MAENMRTTNIMIDYQGSDWGTDLIEVILPENVRDTELIDAIEYGLSEFDSDVVESSQDMVESVLEQVMSSFGGSWHYARQAGTITIEG